MNVVFVFLLIFLGILLSFIHNDYFTKKTTANFFVNDNNNKIYNNEEFLKVDNSNKLLKLVFNNYADEIKNPYLENIKQFIPDKSLFSENKSQLLNIPKDILKDANPIIDNNCTPCVSNPIVTGYASPINFYNPPLTVFFPPPVVVVSTSGAGGLPPPSPPLVPVLEPSSMILGLVGLTGILGFRKKLL